MVACDPAWMRRRPDQRQRSSLGKTLGLRMDGISVRKPFPLGSLVLEPRDQVTTQKHRHERGGDANPHTWGSLSVLQLHSTTNNVSLRPLCSLPSKISTAQYLWVTAKPHQFNLPIHPPRASLHHHFSLLQHPENTQASSQRINRKPWHTLLLRRQRGAWVVCHPERVFFVHWGSWSS